MAWFGVVEIAVILPLALLFLRPPPERPSMHPVRDGAGSPRTLGWNANLVLALLAAAAFMCCVPMAMPQQHMVALCTDLGISATVGAAMLSFLLGTAFVSRQAWGWISDRVGGLTTIFAGSSFQIVAMVAFLFTQDEVGLFTVAGLYGLGFSAIIPAYVLAVRDLFAAAEASWRVPVVLLFTNAGMAFGGWLAGFLYDRYGFYAPAFSAGVLFNTVNLLIVGTLVLRQRRPFGTLGSVGGRA
jgi:MFS family permease